MNSNITCPLARAQFLAQAVATMGVCPAWDRAVTDFVATEIRARADEEYGDDTRRGWDGDEEKRDLERRLGKDWREHPDGKESWARLCEEGRLADERRAARFYEEMWEAQRQIVLTPAPTLAAAIVKAVVIEIHEVWNDNRITVECTDLLDADLARLAPKGEDG